MVALPGCRSETEVPASRQEPPGLSDSELVNPEGTLKLAVRMQDWKKAWETTQYLLKADGLDGETGNAPQGNASNKSSLKTDTWVAMARVAHHESKPELAANWLQRACETEQFKNAERVRQAIIAMVGVGRFYEGMDFIEEVLRSQPDQHENRRWLFDFYVGSDDRVAALKHGEKLVRARKFDIELLLAISNTGRRTLDSKPLDEMVQRNPSDKRPLLGVGKAHLDLREIDKAISVLSQVVETHPKYHPAQAVLGQAYADAADFDAIESWSKMQSDGIEIYPRYWIALGDWARSRGETMAAIKAFGEATRSGDPDVLQAWLRLATLLSETAGRGDLAVSEHVVDAVKQRAQLLGRFSLNRSRFEKTGKISREIALEIAKDLEQLGRWWEAEAWAAIALTLPEDDTVDVVSFRNNLVRRLSPSTPWQVIDGHAEFEPFFKSLPMPAIESVVSVRNVETASNPVIAGTAQTDRVAVPWKMNDEAQTRGLRFHGRTGKELDKPGIMLFRTLGCGGGTIDFDRDGWSDLYLASAGGMPPEKDSSPNELFRNLGGTFHGVGVNANVGDEGFGQGIAIGDINEDGFPDILVLNYGPNRLYQNNGDGTFSDVTQKLKTQPYDEWSSSGAIADIDGDGLADILIVNYCEGLGPVIQACKMAGHRDQIASCSPIQFPAAADRFLKNDGGGAFRDASREWIEIPVRHGRGLGVIVGNLDGGAGNKCLVVNDMTNNHYYEAEVGSAEFKMTESAMIRGMGTDDRGVAQGSMGIANADFDHDGDLDVYVTNFFEEHNTLHVQSTTGIWQDRTSSANLIAPTLPWVGFGSEAMDIDNDGAHELIVTNGHVDLFSREHEKAQYQQPTQLFRISKGLSFEEVDTSSIGDYFTRWHVGRSLWTVDADRDGRLDAVVTHQTEPTALLINQTEGTGNWIRLALHGTDSSRDAIGSVVEIETENSKRFAWRVAGDGYQCSSEPIIHVGLGRSTSATVTVTWPSGLRDRFREMDSNVVHTLVEGTASPGSL